jgi:hypothetical protein
MVGAQSNSRVSNACAGRFICGTIRFRLLRQQQMAADLGIDLRQAGLGIEVVGVKPVLRHPHVTARRGLLPSHCEARSAAAISTNTARA